MYTIIREIGKGGFGIVHEVADQHGTRFAKKTYHINQSFTVTDEINLHLKKRFEREAKLQSGINHRNIVPIIKKNLNDDPANFLMPLADSSLEQAIHKDKTLAGKWTNALLDIISGLEEIHSVKIYHRDLKPGNVLRFVDLEIKGEFFYAISDFGLIALKQTQVSMLTQFGMKMTSDFYTAPEITQDLSAASVQSDIYSLGCILHDFIGNEPRVPCNEIREDGEFSAILLNCTRKDPKRRFKSVSAVREALLTLSISTDVPSTQDGSQIADLLAIEGTLNEKQWQTIADYVEKDLESEDVKLVLGKLDIDRINELISNFPPFALRVGLRYAEWIRSHSFNFEKCDGLAIRLEAFLKIDDLSLQAECLMAMLFMGTSHNRWYVERKFFSYVDSSLEVQLCKRLAIEFRADDTRVCTAISHLESSIGVNRENIHPTLVATLRSICTE